MIVYKILVFCMITFIGALELLTIINPKKTYIIGKKYVTSKGATENGSGLILCNRLLGVVGLGMTSVLFYWLIFSW